MTNTVVVTIGKVSSVQSHEVLSFVVYSNPAPTYVKVKHEGSVLQYRLYDLQGKRLLEGMLLDKMKGFVCLFIIFWLVSFTTTVRRFHSRGKIVDKGLKSAA